MWNVLQYKEAEISIKGNTTNSSTHTDTILQKIITLHVLKALVNFKTFI